MTTAWIETSNIWLLGSSAMAGPVCHALEQSSVQSWKPGWEQHVDGTRAACGDQLRPARRDLTAASCFLSGAGCLLPQPPWSVTDELVCTGTCSLSLQSKTGRYRM